MSQSDSSFDDIDDLLSQFLAEAAASHDQAEILRRYQADHPQHAALFANALAMERKVEQARPAASPEPPSELGGFQLRRRVAQGGMGEVYEAEEPRLRRRVAVKIIRRGQTSPHLRARFLREQLVLAHLHQTHIVPIYAAGEVGVFQFFAMPFIEGATLHHALNVARQPASSWPDGKTPDLSGLARVCCGGTSSANPPKVNGKGHSVAAPTVKDAAPPVGMPSAVRRLLSDEYYRSVARVMADVAEGLDHAHAEGILHRDVKPSNVMITREEKCWIIDFGLAGTFGRPHNPGLTAGTNDPNLQTLTVSGLLGTPQYMAPEQWTAPQTVDTRTDIWGLGTTLYESLTLESAFEGTDIGDIKKSVLAASPKPCHQIANVPSDLEAVCRKALQRDPEQRYSSAREFAADLRRWLRGEPPRVVRHQRLRRFAWFLRQHKGLMAMIAAIVLIVLGAVIGWGYVQSARADAEAARAETERERGDAASARADAEAARAETERERGDAARREVQIQEIQRIRMTEREAPWSKPILDTIEQMAKTRPGDDLRNQAAASFVGLDARQEMFENRAASAVVWDREGKQLLMGAARGSHTAIWHRESRETTSCKQSGRGPVAFGTDGTPLQLIADSGDRWTVTLWDVAQGSRLRDLSIHPLGKQEPIPKQDHRPVSTMTADGRVIAAASVLVGGEGYLAAWEVATGKRLLSVESKPSVLALTPDGSLLAAGDEEGRIRLWSLPDGKELGGVLSSGRMAIHALAFGRNPHQPWREPGANPASPWLLASGENGGRIVVWDLRYRQIKSFCYGSSWDVYAMTISPDGMTLGSSGRGPTARLWDIATGRLLLKLHGGDYATGIALSPDGQHVALSSEATRENDLNTMIVYQLEMGRGMQSLRGLVGLIDQIRISLDGRRVVALSQDWRLAIWDLKTNRLLHIFDVPKGLITDNAGLCLNADGTRVAVSAWSQAKMWDVDSGRELASWGLPVPGLVERLAFRSNDELVLSRRETVDGKPPIRSVARWEDHPRVYAIHHLAVARQVKTVTKIPDFKRGVEAAAISPDGQYVIACGWSGRDPDRVLARIYDGHTGKELADLPTEQKSLGISVRLDPMGKTLAYMWYFGNAGSTIGHLVEVPSGKARSVFSGNFPVSLGPDAKLCMFPHGTEMHDWHFLARREDDKRLLAFGLDGVVDACRFSADGRLLLWANHDGSVTVCDIPEVERRLTAIGLAW